MSCVIPKCSSPYHMSVYDRDSGRTVDVCIKHVQGVFKFGSGRVAESEARPVVVSNNTSAALRGPASSCIADGLPARYRYVGDGREYWFVGLSKGAGTSRGESIVMYQCTETGQLFHRTVEDFHSRMVPV